MKNQGAAKHANGKAHGDLPLVPESVLKRRHDLDDMARRRAAEKAALGLGPSSSSSSSSFKSNMARTSLRGANNSEGAKKTLYVKKPETILASAISRRNHKKRYHRVLRKGMQKRAKNVPVYATKALEDNEDEAEEDVGEDTNERQNAAKTTVKKYQTNSVGATMVLVVRIRDDLGAPRPVLRILANWGLDRPRTASFVKYSDENRKLLHLVEPWVVYGPPSVSLVQDLLERRGHGGRQQQKPQPPQDEVSDASKSKDRRVRRNRHRRATPSNDPGGERIPLSDNTVIEAALGESCHVVCKEDLVHEICALGPNFDAVTSWLWPFVLEDSKTQFERSTLKLKDGRNDYGDRGETIAEYVQSVL